MQLTQGGALGDRQDAARISLGFLDEALFVGERLVGVPLRFLHVSRHLDIGQVDAGDDHARTVLIERALDEFLGAGGDLLAVGHEDGVEGVASDDLADRHLADIPQGLVGVFDLEQILHGVSQLVLNGERHVDEVDVLCQHLRGVVDAADFLRVDLGELLDGPQVEAEAGVTHRHELAEALDDTALGLVDGEEALPRPEERRHAEHDEQLLTVVARRLFAPGRSRPAAAAQDLLELALEVAEGVVTLLGGALSPGVVRAAARFVPCHESSSHRGGS